MCVTGGSGMSATGLKSQMETMTMTIHIHQSNPNSTRTVQGIESKRSHFNVEVMRQCPIHHGTYRHGKTDAVNHYAQWDFAEQGLLSSLPFRNTNVS
jgi:hypothetical protein